MITRGAAVVRPNAARTAQDFGFVNRRSGGPPSAPPAQSGFGASFAADAGARKPPQRGPSAAAPQQPNARPPPPGPRPNVGARGGVQPQPPPTFFPQSAAEPLNRPQTPAPTPTPTPAPGVPVAQFQAFVGQLQELRKKVDELSARVGTANHQPDATVTVTDTIMAVVDGGREAFVPLYATYPAAASDAYPAPVMKAAKGRWLRLTSPAIDVNDVNEQGEVEKTVRWWQAHVVDSKTGLLRVVYAPELTSTGERMFEKFDVYPH